MMIEELSRSLLDWLAAHYLEVGLTALVLFGYWLVLRMVWPKLTRGADESDFEGDRAVGAMRIARIGFAIFAGVLLALIWGVNLGAVFVFATATITLLGVALFASWSILSNITAYFVLLLQPSFARGNIIRLIEGDNYVEGRIADMTLFATKIMTDEKEVILYPNNLILARPVVINPKTRLVPMGKIGPLKEPETTAQ